MSEEQVRVVLNLEKRFEDKPVLQALLVNGEVSINKLARVASIATPENEEALAEQVKLLPQKAIETLVRDEKFLRRSDESLRAHSNPQQSEENANAVIASQSGLAKQSQGLSLSPEVQAKLLDLHNRGLDVNAIVLELLEEREQKIALQKEWLASIYGQTRTRYIPVAARDILKEEYGNKCSIEGCTKASVEIHHTQRFSVGRTHDPKFLAPLCKEHHLIAHAVDRKVFMKREAVIASPAKQSQKYISGT